MISIIIRSTFITRITNCISSTISTNSSFKVISNIKTRSWMSITINITCYWFYYQHSCQVIDWLESVIMRLKKMKKKKKRKKKQTDWSINWKSPITSSIFTWISCSIITILFLCFPQTMSCIILYFAFDFSRKKKEILTIDSYYFHTNIPGQSRYQKIYTLHICFDKDY